MHETFDQNKDLLFRKLSATTNLKRRKACLPKFSLQDELLLRLPQVACSELQFWERSVHGAGGLCECKDGCGFSLHC